MLAGVWGTEERLCHAHLAGGGGHAQEGGVWQLRPEAFENDDL
jgi:hypothetical protein